MSPEIIEKKGVSHKSDIWSLGVIVFTLYFKYYPFFDSNRNFFKLKIKNKIFQKTNKKPPKKIKTLLNLLLEKEVDERPSAQQLLEHPIFASLKKDKEYYNKIVSQYTKNTSHLQSVDLSLSSTSPIFNF